LPYRAAGAFAATWCVNAGLREKDAAGRGRGAAVRSSLSSRPCF